jgi:uncharacterized OB-fold protein
MNAASFPIPDLELPALRPFWLAAAQQRLELPRCAQCQAFNWYPADVCTHCKQTSFNWVELAPHGKLFSWSVVQRPLFPPYAAIAPYIPALVEINDAPGVRLVTRLIDTDPLALSIGARVNIVFADLTYPNTTSGIIAPLAKLA